MLSEEEKKAVSNLNFIVVTDIYDNEVSTNKTEMVNEYNHSVGIVLNLITKLQRENEELKEQFNIVDHECLRLEAKEVLLEKQIDLMAFSLADYVMYYEYDKCRNPEMIKQKAEQIKQCFETKAKEGE